MRIYFDPCTVAWHGLEASGWNGSLFFSNVVTGMLYADIECVHDCHSRQHKHQRAKAEAKLPDTPEVLAVEKRRTIVTF